jgi:hypothetical protein
MHMQTECTVRQSTMRGTGRGLFARNNLVGGRLIVDSAIKIRSKYKESLARGLFAIQLQVNANRKRELTLM